MPATVPDDGVDRGARVVGGEVDGLRAHRGQRRLVRHDVPGPARRRARRSRRPRRPVPSWLAVPPEEVVLADEAGDERRRRVVVDRVGVGELLDVAVEHDRDAVRHRQRLLLVVGDEHEGDADLALEQLQLDLHLLAELAVEGAERLVEQQHRRAVHQRPGERDALLLAARQLPRLALGQLASSSPSRAPRRRWRDIVRPSLTFDWRRP